MRSSSSRRRDACGRDYRGKSNGKRWNQEPPAGPLHAPFCIYGCWPFVDAVATVLATLVCVMLDQVMGHPLAMMARAAGAEVRPRAREKQGS
jgi:hypothetical protein